MGQRRRTSWLHGAGAMRAAQVQIDCARSIPVSDLLPLPFCQQLHTRPRRTSVGGTPVSEGGAVARFIDAIPELGCGRGDG
jgi:hypothetical protein